MYRLYLYQLYIKLLNELVTKKAATVEHCSGF